jgi:hypothetical protein
VGLSISCCFQMLLQMTEVDMDIIHRHPGIKSDIMKQIRLLDIFMRAINKHHERLDGWVTTTSSRASGSVWLSLS